MTDHPVVELGECCVCGEPGRVRVAGDVFEGPIDYCAAHSPFAYFKPQVDESHGALIGDEHDTLPAILESYEEDALGRVKRLMGVTTRGRVARSPATEGPPLTMRAMRASDAREIWPWLFVAWKGGTDGVLFW